MRSVAILILFLAGMAACKNGDKKAVLNNTSNAPFTGPGNAAETTLDTTNFTTIQWLDSTYLDLGEQKEGKELEISFRFKNTGTKNLVIENVSAQCGCTVPEKPEQPFAPGEEGVIKAKYNGSGHDETRKQVYIRANIKPDGSDTLTFRAFLIK
jgi:hypothetical protein